MQTVKKTSHNIVKGFQLVWLVCKCKNVHTKFTFFKCKLNELTYECTVIKLNTTPYAKLNAWHTPLRYSPCFRWKTVGSWQV